MRWTITETSTKQKEAWTDEGSWFDLCEFLCMCSLKGRPATKNHKEFETPAILPAIWKDGETEKFARTALGAEHIAIDLDHETLSLDDIKEFMEALGWRYVAWTTTNSKPSSIRVKILLPTSRFVEQQEWHTFWAGANAYFGLEMDSHCKNINRLAYVPATWVDTATGASFSEFWCADGLELDVGAMIAHAPAPPPPQPVRTAQGRLSPGHRILLKQMRRNPHLLDPFRSPFVSDGMRAKYLAGPEGGRLWRFMMGVKGKAVNANYPLTASELERIAYTWSRYVNPDKERTNLTREAERVLQL